MWKTEPAKVPASPVEVGGLEKEELQEMKNNAGEINFLMEEIWEAVDSGEAGLAGRKLADFSIYMFKLGRDHANKRSS